jgi:inosine/xanthosine triphosphatase
MKTILVASTNPVKLEAARRGFQRMFPGEPFAVNGISASSGVSHQPRSDAETLQGALRRAESAAALEPNADYWVGIEGGVDEQIGGMCAFAWVVVRSREQTGKSRTGAFFLPPQVVEYVRQGKELGEADDLVFGRSNSKQTNGAIGLLTGDIVDRAALYEQAIILALVPFKNGDLYDESRYTRDLK